MDTTPGRRAPCWVKHQKHSLPPEFLVWCTLFSLDLVCQNSRGGVVLVPSSPYILRDIRPALHVASKVSHAAQRFSECPVSFVRAIVKMSHAGEVRSTKRVDLAVWREL